MTVSGPVFRDLAVPVAAVQVPSRIELAAGQP